MDNNFVIEYTSQDQVSDWNSYKIMIENECNTLNKKYHKLLIENDLLKADVDSWFGQFATVKNELDCIQNSRYWRLCKKLIPITGYIKKIFL